MAHLSHDEAVTKMGHPALWLESDLGHPPLGVVARYRPGSLATDTLPGATSDYLECGFYIKVIRLTLLC